jgi:putative (di)nucleoside polyphosphate hydrolase
MDDHESELPFLRSNLPYRQGVGMVLINREGQIFVGQRTDVQHEAWQMPQGGIDQGETTLEAAFRELEEEVGTKNCELLKVSDYWYTYDIPAFIIPRLWEGQYRGQRQKWFLFRLLGDESEINIQTQHPEFTSWRWITCDELLDVAVMFKRFIYLEVLKEFREYFPYSVTING